MCVRVCVQAGDLWGVVRMRQEALALAKVCKVTSRHLGRSYPMLLPAAHYKLAQAYADLGCAAQAMDHCQE